MLTKKEKKGSSLQRFKVGPKAFAIIIFQKKKSAKNFSNEMSYSSKYCPEKYRLYFQLKPKLHLMDL